MPMNRTDVEILRKVGQAYRAAITRLGNRTPREIAANGVEAERIIDRIRGSLRGDESFEALTIAFIGYLVALADEPEAQP